MSEPLEESKPLEERKSLEERKPLLELRDVGISLTGQPLLTHVNLTVNAGEAVALCGTSGRGKSTLLKAICGLLPKSFVRSGQILFQGTDLSTLSAKQWQQLRGPGMALMGQNVSENFDERASVLSHFVEAVHAHDKKRTRESIKAQALELLYRLELAYPERILSQKSYEFSQGMSQRIALALTLMLRPQLILADEFTSALDLSTRLAVLTELKTLQAEFGFALLFVTHHPDEASFMAQRRYDLTEDGTITETGIGTDTGIDTDTGIGTTDRTSALEEGSCSRLNT